MGELAPTARRLGWGVVGCGWVARDYGAPGIEASANGRVAAVFDADPARRPGLASAVLGARGGPRSARASRRSWPTRASRPSTSPRRTTGTPRSSRPAPRAGKHVLCEKPMATHPGRRPADGRRLRAGRGRSTRRPSTSGSTPPIAGSATWSPTGRLGVVSQARIHYACWLPADWAADNWRVDPRRAGGGALIDLAPHGVDLLAMLLGDEWETLVALTQRRVHGYAVDDGAVLAGRFRGGVVASIHVAYNCPDAYPRRPPGADRDPGDGPGDRHDGPDPRRLARADRRGFGAAVAVAIDPGDDRSPFAAQAEAFAASVLGGRPYPFPPGRDLRNFALLEAACR